MIGSIKRTLGIASVALVATFVAPAANATVFIGESTVGPITNLSVSPGGTATGTFGNFTATVTSSSGGPDYLNSNAIGGSTTGSGTLTLYVTETGLTQAAQQLFLSGFSSNNLPGGLSVTEQTFLDTGNSGNNVFTTATPLGSQSFTAFGAVQQTPNLGPLAGPFSITEVYTINAPGAGTFNATIDVSAVPEPATWAMLILGFLGRGLHCLSARKFRFFSRHLKLFASANLEPPLRAALCSECKETPKVVLRPSFAADRRLVSVREQAVGVI